LDVLLKQIGSQWYADRAPVDWNTKQQAGSGWTFVVRHDNNKSFVLVYCLNELLYECDITHARNVLLLPEGGVELNKINQKHRQLAELVTPALPAPLRGVASVKVVLLDRNGHINGRTFNTAASANDHFSDAKFHTVSHESSRVTIRCVGGTYLVRVRRRDNSTIFAIEVAAQQNYSPENLVRTLRHLA
jgi:hypothetical protein